MIYTTASSNYFLTYTSHCFTHQPRSNPYALVEDNCKTKTTPPPHDTDSSSTYFSSPFYKLSYELLPSTPLGKPLL